MSLTKSKYEVFEHQPDSVTIIASPVSGTKYGWRAGVTGDGAELGTQKRVRLIGVSVELEWAVTQPTPLEVYLTIGTETIKFSQADPVTATPYTVRRFDLSKACLEQLLEDILTSAHVFLLEDGTLKVEVEITWETTQPTNLTMRVKWEQKG